MGWDEDGEREMDENAQVVEWDLVCAVVPVLKQVSE